MKHQYAFVKAQGPTFMDKCILQRIYYGLLFELSSGQNLVIRCGLPFSNLVNLYMKKQKINPDCI